MAATETVGILEDDEDWLYGDEKEKKPDVEKLDKKIASGKKKEGDKEAGELESGDDGERQNKSVDNADAGAGEEEEDDDDDDDDDDNVQVTIGDIRTWTGTETTPRNLFKSGQNYQKGITISPAKPMPATKGLDIEAVGTINGTPVYEFDLNSLSTEEMAWRKPGADINDYFNYGFTEDTWKAYCEKQKMMRPEAASLSANKVTTSGVVTQNTEKPVQPPVVQSNSISIVNTSTNPISSNAKSGNNNIITIGVIGGSTSRRKDDSSMEQPIPVAGSFFRKRQPFEVNSNRAIHVNFNQPPPSLPNTNMPPPRMAIPLPFGTPMPTFDPYYPSPMPGQPLPLPNYGGPFLPAYPPHFVDPNPPAVTPQPHWEPSFHDRNKWDLARRDNEIRERSPPRREDDYDRLAVDETLQPPTDDRTTYTFKRLGGQLSTTAKHDTRYVRDRDQDRDRDWDREREKDRDWEKSRDRSRDRERSRERDRSRDRDRSRIRDRSKDMDKERDRDRDRERERDRDRSRSKERASSRNRDQERARDISRARDRDDKHKPSRRKHRDRELDDSDAESSRSSSKHKKSKKKKDAKDDEPAAPGTGDEKPRD